MKAVGAYEVRATVLLLGAGLRIELAFGTKMDKLIGTFGIIHVDGVGQANKIAPAGLVSNLQLGVDFALIGTYHWLPATTDARCPPLSPLHIVEQVRGLRGGCLGILSLMSQ